MTNIDKESDLIKELEKFCTDNRYPHTSCDELLAEIQNKHTDFQMQMKKLEADMDWCVIYIERWENKNGKH